MAKFVSPLLGYNNNVRHKNRVFHIQTEDSGVNHPHIITHLFMDGGRILKSVKKSYAEHVGTDGMKETVRQMMKEQHKAMFIALRDGQFDHLVDPTATPKDAAPKDAPPEAPKEGEEQAVAAPAEAAPEPAPAPAATEPMVPDAPPTAPDPVVPVAAPAPAASSRPEPIAGVAAAENAPSPRLALVDSEPDVVPATTRQAEPPVAPPVQIDLAAVEQQPAAAASSLFQANDLPPPPKNLFTKERGTNTSYRTVDAEPEKDIGRPAAKPAPSKSPAAPRVAPAAANRPAQPAARSEAGRYAPARPAAIFGAPAKPQAQSIFSDDLVSDKSLDEVILSYLAEDLEPPRRK